MPGVKGRSGTSPKSEEHRAAIAQSLREYWASEAGRRERALRRQIAREIQAARRRGA